MSEYREAAERIAANNDLQDVDDLEIFLGYMIEDFADRDLDPRKPSASNKEFRIHIDQSLRAANRLCALLSDPDTDANAADLHATVIAGITYGGYGIRRKQRARIDHFPSILPALGPLAGFRSIAAALAPIRRITERMQFGFDFTTPRKQFQSDLEALIRLRNAIERVKTRKIEARHENPRREYMNFIREEICRVAQYFHEKTGKSSRPHKGRGSRLFAGDVTGFLTDVMDEIATAVNDPQLAELVRKDDGNTLARMTANAIDKTRNK